MFVRIAESDGSITMELPGHNVSFKMPGNIADVDLAGYAAKYFDDAADSLGTLIKVSAEIGRDAELSDVGKKKRLEPKQAAVLETIANRWDAIGQEEVQIAAREDALFKVPTLDPMHSAMAIEDREIRDYLRSIGDASAMSYLLRPEHERLRIALLRSPLPVTEALKQRALEVWKEGKRQANPAEAATIDSERAGIEWSRRGLAQVAGISRSFLKDWDNDRIVKQIITSGNEFTKRGYAAFGFGPVDVARVQRQLDYAALRQA